jgi:hypothetical protein
MQIQENDPFRILGFRILGNRDSRNWIIQEMSSSGNWHSGKCTFGKMPFRNRIVTHSQIIFYIFFS